jgi:LacI family transcriptional regulator
MPRTTLSDVARACGVSPATVSKALNPHADRCDLSPATRAKVIAAAQALGFRPSVSHGRRTRRLWRNIGLVWARFAPFTSGVYEGVLDIIGERLIERGWRLFYTPVPDAAAWREMQMAQRLDGVLAVSHVPETALAAFATEGYPAVLLNLRSPLPLPQFLPDEVGGMTLLAEHLAELGHRSLVYVPHHDSGVGHFSEVERPATLHAVAQRCGMRVTEIGHRALPDLVASCRAGATAVICYDWNDIPQVLAALNEAGLAVPKAVSVACCADVKWFAHLTPAVTAIEIPMRELAVLAINDLLVRIDGEAQVPAAPRVLPTTLRLRASTGPVCRL